MSFLNFEPKPENELIDLLEVGDGDFEVLEAAEKHSKSNGNPMIELKLKVWDSKGHEGIIFDYLMLTNSNFSLRKIRHFCYSCGLAYLYDQGSLSAGDCVGKAGKLKIDFQKGNNGYSDKNVVKDYISGDSIPGKRSAQDSTSALEKMDDDIPF
jgi:hypothetical protein